MSHKLPVAVTEERGRIIEFNETCRAVGPRTSRIGVKCCCLVTDGYSDVDVIFTSLT